MSFTFRFERPPIKGSHGLTGCTREERLQIEANRLVVLREKIARGDRPCCDERSPWWPSIYHHPSFGTRA